MFNVQNFSKNVIFKKCIQLCIFILHKFLKYTILCTHCTQFSKQYTQFCTFNMHNFVYKGKDFVYSMYTFFQFCNINIHKFSNYILWGQRIWGLRPILISSPRPAPRIRKCPRMNEGNPNRQIVLPRMTLSSASQNQGRKKHHVARGNPLKDRKRDSKPHGLAIGEWGRDNPRKSRHLRIKYPQLTP